MSVTAPLEDSNSQQRAESDSVLSPNGSSSRNSPEMEIKSEELYHKKFDKLRKHPTSQQTEETRRMENLSINDAEQMESDDICIYNTDNGVNSEKGKKSACDAHPQLLAQLKSGPQYKPNIHQAFQAAAGPQLVNYHHIQSQQQQQQTNGFSLKGAVDTLKNHRSISPNNVVLSVPKAPFVNRISPSTSPSSASSVMPSMINDHPCLQNILNSRGSDQFCSVEKSASPASNKQQEVQSENEHKVELSQESQNFRNGQIQQQPMYPSFGVQGGLDPQSAVMQNPYMLYQQVILQQQGVRVPQYNEHLANMQQMVYGGNPQQLRR